MAAVKVQAPAEMGPGRTMLQVPLVMRTLTLAMTSIPNSLYLVTNRQTTPSRS